MLRIPSGVKLCLKPFLSPLLARFHTPAPPSDHFSAVIPGPGRVQFLEEPPPRHLEANQILIQNHYTLVSPGTELAIFQKTHVGFSDPTNTYARYPFRPGYAAVGRVAAKGENVSTFQEGDWLLHMGRHQTCVVQTVEKDNLLPLPPGLDPQLALFARMAQISASAREVSHAQPGSNVIVLGLGLVGNLAAQLFQGLGCTVLGIDSLAGRCQIANQCGIRTFQPKAPQSVSQICTFLDGASVGTVIEATGHPPAIAKALELVAPGGEVILLGSTRGKVELDFYKLVHSRGVVIRGAHENILNRSGTRRREILAEQLEAIQTGQLKVAPLLSEPLDCRELALGYRKLVERRAETLSVILKWRP